MKLCLKSNIFHGKTPLPESLLPRENILNIGGGDMTTSTALCVSNGTSLVKKVEKTPTRQTNNRKNSGT